MPSSFAWLDYSESERRRALDVISLFRFRDTRDELGLAGIRDPIAELLSPGTTTIQTRARYFLIVPWIFRSIERLRIRSQDAPSRARKDEERLVRELSQSDDLDGVIGREAGAAVKRMPSSIYWPGLRRWGILKFQGSQAQYYRSLDRFYLQCHGHRAREREDRPTGPEPANWHAYLPDPPAGFPTDASLTLSEAEAVYLRERILSTTRGSLLAWLVDATETWEPVDFAWEHPEYSRFPGRISEQLEHARTFSETMFGSSLLYNLLLSEAIGREDWIENYRSSFEQWASEESERAERLHRWDVRELWQLASRDGHPPALLTRRFVETWVDRVRRARDVRSLAEAEPARRLIRDREYALKRGRARLQNRRHLELWGGAAGSAQLDFRWGITQRLVRDILAGLSSGAD